MDESRAIQAKSLSCIKNNVAAIKLLRLKSLTFGGHIILQYRLIFVKISQYHDCDISQL